MVDGSDTHRSSSGQAPRAIEGVMLGEGETERSGGEPGRLVGGVDSAMIQRISRESAAA